LFFLSAKLSNVSVSVIALSTTALWTALLEPLMVRGKPWRRSEVLFGVLVIGAVAFLFDEGSPHLGGFLVGVGAALVGTVFSIFNGWFAGRWSHHKISLHEMMGTALVCALCLPLSALGWFGENEGYDLLPSGSEWIWLMVLSLVCTVYAFGEYIELLERISVYTINLANNLEPLYGILLAAWLFAEWAELDGRFYLTSAVIVGVVGMHSWWEGRPSYPSSKVKGS
ncbi:MAG: DMT family transporter, partial [Verrucomicrobiota bacterium]